MVNSVGVLFSRSSGRALTGAVQDTFIPTAVAIANGTLASDMSMVRMTKVWFLSAAAVVLPRRAFNIQRQYVMVRLMEMAV